MDRPDGQGDSYICTKITLFAGIIKSYMYSLSNSHVIRYSCINSCTVPPTWFSLVLLAGSFPVDISGADGELVLLQTGFDLDGVLPV